MTEPTDAATETIRQRVEALLGRLDDTSEAQGELPPRVAALELLFEQVESESLRAHMLSVEAAMRAYAVRLQQNPERYGITGLLHDVDYEQHPTQLEHPMVGCGLLLDAGYPSDVVRAILGHATYTGVARDSLMARVLFAVDELTGFLTAIAYVRPSGLQGLSMKSFKKKLKTPSFAAGVDRNDVLTGAAELGVEMADHVMFVAEALRVAFPSFPRVPEASDLGSC